MKALVSIITVNYNLWGIMIEYRISISSYRKMKPNLPYAFSG